jgi:hypothetical protein
MIDKRYLFGSIILLFVFLILTLLIKDIIFFLVFVVSCSLFASLAFLGFGPYLTLMANQYIKFGWKGINSPTEQIKRFNKNVPKLIKIQFFITISLIPLSPLVYFENPLIALVIFPTIISFYLLGTILGIMFSSKIVLTDSDREM